MLHTPLAIATKYDYLSDKFRAAFKWLAETDLAATPDGKYSVLDGQVIADVQSYTSEPAESRRFEAHDKFFDIQYVFEVEEFFGVCSREDAYMPKCCVSSPARVRKVVLKVRA